MATCPECQSREFVFVEPTDRVVYVAAPPGAYSLAGCRMKAEARAYAVYRLGCSLCGWSDFVRYANERYMVPINE